MVSERELQAAISEVQGDLRYAQAFEEAGLVYMRGLRDGLLWAKHGAPDIGALESLEGEDSEVLFERLEALPRSIRILRGDAAAETFKEVV